MAQTNNLNGIPSEVFVENSAARNFLAVILTLGLQTPGVPNDYIEKAQEKVTELCQKVSDNSESTCSRIVNNALWQMCQSIESYEPCEKVSFRPGTNDIVWSVWFWAGIGMFLGALGVFLELTVYYCLCKKKTKKSKGMATGAQGAGPQGSQGP